MSRPYITHEPCRRSILFIHCYTSWCGPSQCSQLTTILQSTHSHRGPNLIINSQQLSWVYILEILEMQLIFNCPPTLSICPPSLPKMQKRNILHLSGQHCGDETSFYSLLILFCFILPQSPALRYFEFISNSCWSYSGCVFLTKNSCLSIFIKLISCLMHYSHILTPVH